LRRSIFVGLVDHHLSLIQVNTKLLLINHAQFARELFYQQVLRLFSNCYSFALVPAVNVYEMALLALEGNDLGEPEERISLANEVVNLLQSKQEMLEDYFGIRFKSIDNNQHTSTTDINSNSENRSPTLYLTHLPRLLDNHTPLLEYIPDFLLTLAYNVDWTNEKLCFQTIAQTIAAFYAQLPLLSNTKKETIPVLSSTNTSLGTTQSETKSHLRNDKNNTLLSNISNSSGTINNIDNNSNETNHPNIKNMENNGEINHQLLSSSITEFHAMNSSSSSETINDTPDSISLVWFVKQLLLPALRKGLTPPRKLITRHHIIQIACTEQLYKIFERC